MTSQSGTNLTSLQDKIGSGFLRNIEKSLGTTRRQIIAGEHTLHIQRAENGKYQLTLYSPVVNTWISSLTFNNSTFCPLSAFMCFVWISEQTAIISLYSIN